MTPKKKSPNHSSYRNKADELFMAQFRGLPCAVCGKTHMTCGHHIVPKSRSKALRYDARNIIVLCQEHHTLGNTMAPHSTNQLAVERFIIWFKATHPRQHQWAMANEHTRRKYSYRQAVENLQVGRVAWE